MVTAQLMRMHQYSLSFRLGLVILHQAAPCNSGLSFARYDCQSGVWQGQGLGYGQTWKDMTGSALGCGGVRASGVICTNSTNKPIQVSINIRSTGGAAGLYVNGLLISYWSSAAVDTHQINGIVPIGDAYYISIAGAATAFMWTELR